MWRKIQKTYFDAFKIRIIFLTAGNERNNYCLEIHSLKNNNNYTSNIIKQKHILD